MLYQRGDVWWFKFMFAGRMFRESAKTRSIPSAATVRTVSRDARPSAKVRQPSAEIGRPSAGGVA